MFESEKLTPDLIEKVSDKTEMVRSPEEVRDMLKKEFLIVDDGYDYQSEVVPDDLPTVFHGTSAWLENDVEKDGLTNEVDNVQNIEAIFKVHPDLHRLFKHIIRRNEGIANRMKPDKNIWRRKVYCTYSHENADNYTRGPEILRDYLELMEGASQSFCDTPFESLTAKIISELGVIDTHEKKLLMSCLDPKSLIVHAKATKEEFDAEETFKYAGEVPELTFLTSIEGRKELFEEIKWARERYIRHLKGDLVSSGEASRMWSHIVSVANLTNAQEFEAISIPDLVQAYLRRNPKELLFNKINPESITELEKV